MPFAHRARSLFDVTSMVDILEHIQLDKLCQKTHANYVQTKEHLEHGIAGDRTVLMNLREGHFRKKGTVSFDQQPATLRLSPQEAGRALENVAIARCVAVEVRTNVGKIGDNLTDVLEGTGNQPVNMLYGSPPAVVLAGHVDDHRNLFGTTLAEEGSPLYRTANFTATFEDCRHGIFA